MKKFFIKGSHPTPFVYEIKPGEKVMIGRGDDCDLHIDSPEISRKHCLVSFKDGQLFVKDAKSKLGTKVNGSKIDEVKIKTGDKITLSPYSSFKISTKGAPVIQKNAINESESSIFDTSAVTSRVEKVETNNNDKSNKHQSGMGKKKIGIYVFILVILCSLILLSQLLKNDSVVQKDLNNDQCLAILDNVLKQFQENNIIDEALLKKAVLKEKKYDTAEQLEKSLKLFAQNPANDPNYNWDQTLLQLNKLKNCLLISRNQEKWIAEKISLSQKEKVHQKISKEIFDLINREDPYKALLKYKTLPQECIYKQHHSQNLNQIKDTYTAKALKHNNILINNKKFLEASEIFNNLTHIHKDNKRKHFQKQAQHYKDLDNDLKQYSSIMKFINEEKFEDAQELFKKINPNSTYQRAITREMQILSKTMNSKNAKELYRLGNIESALSKLDSSSEADRELEKHIKRVSGLYRKANDALIDKNLNFALEKWKEVCLLESDTNNEIVIDSQAKLKKWKNTRSQAQTYLDWGDDAVEKENYDEARKMYKEANQIKPKSANLHIEQMTFLAEKYYLSAIKSKSKPREALKLYSKAFKLITSKDKLYGPIKSEINALEAHLKNK